MRTDKRENFKALVLASGGVDSTTALALAIEAYGRENTMALFMSYGQKHEREKLAAAQVAEYYDVRIKYMDVTRVFADSDSSLLVGSTQDIPKSSYDEQIKAAYGDEPVSTYVPFRNGLFLSAAASIALSNGCEIIYYGAHADDAAGAAYPDCSPQFNDAMASAIWEGSGKQLKIKAPFVGSTKSDIVKTGLELGVPYELTWSCYEGGEEPCGCCGTCIDRAKAFRDNGVDDPLLDLQ